MILSMLASSFSALYRPISGPCAVVRVDPAHRFASLSNGEELRRHKITVEIGRVKNVNKNPVAKKCIAELGDELLRVSPEGGAVSPVTLAIATANLNTRICDGGLSACEMWYQRGQFTNSQLPISDLHLIREQHSHRIHNHPASEKSKTPSGQRRASPALQVGDLFNFRWVQNSCMRCNVRKFAGSQLRSTPYCIKLSECFLVTNNFTPHLQVLISTNLSSPLQLLNPSLPVHLESRKSYPIHLTAMIVFYPHLTPLVCLVLITNAPHLIKLTNTQLVFLAPASQPSPPLHPKSHLLPLDIPVANAILPFTCRTLLHS
jgi:hypothetical protein